MTEARDALILATREWVRSVAALGAAMEDWLEEQEGVRHLRACPDIATECERPGTLHSVPGLSGPDYRAATTGCD